VGKKYGTAITIPTFPAFYSTSPDSEQKKKALVKERLDLVSEHEHLPTNYP